MTMLEYRTSGRASAAVRLRRFWFGLLLASPLLGACDGSDVNGPSRGYIPAPRPASASPAGAYGSRVPDLVAGELPAVIVAARRLDQCPHPHDRRAARMPSRAELLC